MAIKKVREPMEVVTVGQLMDMLSQYSRDAVIIMDSDNINGAWSNITTNTCKVHLHSDYYDGNHKFFEDNGWWDNTSEIDEYLEDNPDVTLVDGVHIN
jgi:hypothetical protein